MKDNQQLRLQGQKMQGYPEKIFDEITQLSSKSEEKLQITLSALMTLGISVRKAKTIYLQLQDIVCQSPRLNRYDILIHLAEKIALL